MANPNDSTKGTGFLNRALTEYLRLLQDRPVITKASTNAIVSGLGNIISQLLVPDQTISGKINWRSVFAYTTFGFFVSGPLVHHFYIFLEKNFPKSSPHAALKRVLLDRLVFSPPLLLIFLYYASIVEGVGNRGAALRIRASYWMILRLNWTVWTVIQFINMKYVPLKYRTIFGNICGLLWMVYISIKRRQAMK